MEFGEKNVPLLWNQKEPVKKSSVVDLGKNDTPRWPPHGTGQDGRRAAAAAVAAAGDVASHEQFTDAVPELPVYKVKQNANTIGAVLYLIVLTIYAASIVASAVLIPRPHNYLVKSITCSCNALLLVVTGLLQRHLVAEQQKEQRQGYIKFSKDLDWIIHLPFSVFSIGTAGLLLVVVWQSKEWKDGIPPLFLIRVLILVQIFLTAVLTAAYLRKVHQHHAVERHPDVMNSLYSALNPPVSLGSMRYNDGGLAEQQALLLNYQQNNLRYLSEEILRLQETLSKFDRTQDGNTPQVDVVHLLAAREQELRAVTVERDQLLAELRLSRSLIGERDAAIKQVQAINHQYIEELERVRAMLDEWSSRTAKVKLMLKVLD